MPIIITPTNELKVIATDSVDVLKQVIGGYIESLPLANLKVMLMDKDGGTKDLPANTIATLLLRDTAPGSNAVVRGTVVYLTLDQFGELK